jgi:integrase
MRYLLMGTAVETGLRANEVTTLTVGSFDFVNPGVTVGAVDAKGKREDVQTLRPDTALLLQQFFRGKMSGAKTFGGTAERLTAHTAEMVREDLTAMEVQDAKGKVVGEAALYVNDARRVADFHSLRHTTGTLLAASGVHPKVVQKIMRHMDTNLTMSLYTHVLKG